MVGEVESVRRVSWRSLRDWGGDRGGREGVAGGREGAVS